jgi:hypothetical protein
MTRIFSTLLLTLAFILALGGFSSADEVRAQVEGLQKGVIVTDQAGPLKEIELRDVRLLDAQGRVLLGKDVIATFRRNTAIVITRENERVVSIQATSR